MLKYWENIGTPIYRSISIINLMLEQKISGIRAKQQRYKTLVRETTVTFMHLADAFIQSDLQCIQAIHFFVSM